LGIWKEMVDHVLVSYLKDTTILVFGVGGLASLFGVSTAWLVTAYQFPGRRFFSWALILPLAIPGYIAAYVYSEIDHYTVEALIFTRDHFGPQWQRALDQSMKYIVGCVVLASVLYPYVYLLARASFQQQARTALQASRMLGRNPFQTFFRIALPMARPGIIGGLSLVLMEVLNDYGAVHFFGIATLTTGIFKYWYAEGNLQAAMSISACLMAFILLLTLLERLQRGQARFEDTDSRSSDGTVRPRLPWIPRCLAVLACAVPFFLGFLFPVWKLLGWAYRTAGDVLNADFFELLTNSLTLAASTAAVILIVSVALAYTVRLHRTTLMKGLSRLWVLGYAVPGAVVAIGVGQLLAWFDFRLDALTDRSLGLILSGSLVAVGFGYLVRFLAVSFFPTESGMEKICGNLDQASRALGVSPWKTFIRINLPLLKAPLLGAIILLFVDILKELPLTLILRPFNFETLATKTFDLAMEGRIPESANPSLIIVAGGVVAALLLGKVSGRAPSSAS
ncbi:MAG: iron ABC transporter permease, partial [Verrucomicrobiota bacterium]